MYSTHIVWAPDGDEAFDDGSVVLHFDIGEKTRVIAFRSISNVPDIATLREAWLSIDEFYSILHDWRNAFIKEWTRLPKNE